MEAAMKERHKATVFGLIFVVYTLLLAGMFYAMGSADAQMSTTLSR